MIIYSYFLAVSCIYLVWASLIFARSTFAVTESTNVYGVSGMYIPI